MPRSACRAVLVLASGIVLAALHSPALGPATAFAADAAEIKARIDAGDAAAMKLDLAAATRAYREVLALAPDSYDANWRLARALADTATLSADDAERKRLCGEAEGYARTAVRLDGNDARGHTVLAIAVGKLALFEGGKRKVELSKEVKAEAERALAIDPADDVALHVLGVWNREMVQLSWFLRNFAQLLYGKFPPASIETATADLRRATELKPPVIAHHAELGITLAAARRWEDAKKELDTALALPTGWVTDDHYRGKARAALAEVSRHLSR